MSEKLDPTTAGEKLVNRTESRRPISREQLQIRDNERLHAEQARRLLRYLGEAADLVDSLQESDLRRTAKDCVDSLEPQSVRWGEPVTLVRRGEFGVTALARQCEVPLPLEEQCKLIDSGAWPGRNCVLNYEESYALLFALRKLLRDAVANDTLE